MKPTHLDLFSGIGGFTLAAQAVGFETIGFSEIEPYACAVLKKHWPHIPNLGDVRSIGDVRCDLVTGGFPCQPHSLAGKRKGSSDDRHLWPAMRDVIGRCKPAWVCGENVPGIIGVELGQVLSDLESLGYRVQPLVIPACAVDAPHRRDRVWIVANARERRFGGPGDGQSEQPRRAEVIGASEAVANTMCSRGRQIAGGAHGDEATNEGWTQEHNHVAGGSGEALANASSAGLEGRNGEELREREAERITRTNGPSLSDTGYRGPRTKSEGQRFAISSGGCCWLPEAESGVGRVAHGIPNRAHRLRGLGNSIVPQVAQVILAAIYKELTKEPSVA